jgi:hypothetical protein
MMEAAERMVPIETAEGDLRRLLAQLRLGETIMLVGSSGVPEALLVSLKSAPDRPLSTPDWEARWDALVGKVNQAWKGDKSALETLTEMRR